MDFEIKEPSTLEVLEPAFATIRCVCILPAGPLRDALLQELITMLRVINAPMHEFKINNMIEDICKK